MMKIIILLLICSMVYASECFEKVNLHYRENNVGVEKIVSLCRIGRETFYSANCQKQCKAMSSWKNFKKEKNPTLKIGSPGHTECRQFQGNPMIVRIEIPNEKTIASMLCWFNDDSFATNDLLKQWKDLKQP